MIVVDPVLGDAPGGLYVSEAVARAVAARLVPLADWITPNLWELAKLSGREITTAADARDAARALGRPALVTSTPAGEDEIGVLYVDAETATLFAHPRADAAPKGTGDLVSASFAAGLIEGLAPRAAAARATRAAAEAVAAAKRWRTDELPVVAIADRLVRPEAALREQTL
jgi:pyridoxine kinase